MTYLIADSGSTKTSWVFIDGTRQESFETTGINPVRDSENDILRAIPDGFAPTAVYFYGAGCISPYSDAVYRMLGKRFANADIHVMSDLLGAAHALCGNKEGIACILGTGSNSCLYDGRDIVQNVSPLGWILGDEGSGAVLGRLLVGNILKGQFPPYLCQAFEAETGLTRAHIINKVYREAMPNRFLASLVPFLGHHREAAEVHDFLVNEFRRFFIRNVAYYHRNDLPVSFVGGIAWSFTDELAEAARLEGYTLGHILQRPIDNIVNYIFNTR